MAEVQVLGVVKVVVGGEREERDRQTWSHPGWEWCGAQWQ